MDTDCTAEREGELPWKRGHYFANPVVSYRNEGEQMKEGSGRGCGRGREGERINSVEKRGEVLIFHEREDLLPRLRAISY